MISFQLAKEIYGMTPWLMDVHSIPVMSTILGSFKNGAGLESPEVKLNTPYVISSKEKKIIDRPYGDGWSAGQLENNENFTGIGLIKLNGPITKNGGASSLGMVQLSSLMLEMSQDERIISFVVLTDSGGGSSAAVQLMVDTITKVKQTKPVIGIIEKGGLAASAAYGIISSCDEIYAEDPMSIVGSVGTMIQFEGREANAVSADGVKHIRLYATKSTKKNEAFEEALNNDNYKVLINDLLDPINENFINMVATNRPKIEASDFNDGRTYFAKDVIGTYIDGIKSFEEVVDISASYRSKKPKTKNENKNRILNNNFKNKKMTKAEFKTANPDAYAEIVAEGIASEKDRSGAWLAHVSTDPKSVVEGINSGKAISQTEREAFFVKQNSLAQAKGIIEDSNEDIASPESGNPKKIANQKIEKEVKEAFDFELK